MMKNTQTVQGTYFCSRDEQEIKTLQNKRTLFLSISTALLVFPSLFIKQAAMEKLTEINLTSVTTAVLLLFFVTACFSVYSLIMGFLRYRLVKRLPAKNHPKLDTDKHTWSVIEWSFYLTVLFTLAQIALCIYCFSVGSLIVALCLVASSAASYIAKRISFLCYRGTLTFVSLEEQLADAIPPENEENDFYNE